jgi:hypothetical protein
MNRRHAHLTIAALAACLVPPLRAQGQGQPAVPVPAARPLLTVSGRIRRTNDAEGKAFRFSEEEFFRLPQHAIVTATVWTPRSRFEGPLLSDVLQHVGAEGRELYMSALNDYTISIPWEDMDRYGVILAHSRNGARMGPSNYGPLWLMYPRDQYPEALSGPLASARYIWQVKAIEVR